MKVPAMQKGKIVTERSWRTSVAMDTVVIINELLQEGLVLFQDIIAHVRDVVQERLVFDLPREQEEASVKNEGSIQRHAYKR